MKTEIDDSYKSPIKSAMIQKNPSKDLQNNHNS